MHARMDWEYLAGFLDGDGTVGMWASAGRPKAINRVAWFNTHRETLAIMHEFLGVGYLHDKKWRQPRVGRKAQYELTVGTRGELIPVLQHLIPYLIEKREAAEDVLAHIAPALDVSSLTRSQGWSMGWSYMAAFLDAEGTVNLSTGTKRGHAALGISWHNSHLPTLQRIQAFTHAGRLQTRQHSGFNGTKPNHVLKIGTKDDILRVAEGMRPHLIQKRDKLDALVAALADVDGTRWRNRGVLAQIPEADLRRLYDEGMSMAQIAAHYDASTGGIQRLFLLYGIKGRPAGGGHLKGKTHSPETIAKMKATRAAMWADPAYAARMREQLYLGHQAPHTRGWKNPTIQGENHPRSKLSNAQTAEIRTKHAAGATQSALAREYGVSDRTIFNIVHQRIRTNV